MTAQPQRSRQLTSDITNSDGIHWRDWHEDIFSDSDQEHKPILLALTATWCHWCHVMDQTSYSHPEIINLINAYFIPTRVDVDVRPDLARKYNQGGFPSLAVLNNRGRLLLGKVYSPPEELSLLLDQVKSNDANPVENDRHRKLPDTSHTSSGANPNIVTPQDRVLNQIRSIYDPVFGGLGDEPKQPPWETVRLLMDLYSKTGDKELLNMARTTLDGIQTGLFDSNDQGFFRYSVSRDWKVPHYEKMLVTNANLAITYSEAYQLTRKFHYKQAAVGTINYLINTLYDSSKNGFYASQDAEETYYQLPWKDRTLSLQPSIDPTLYCGWNSLAATALLKCSHLHRSSDYEILAIQIIDSMWQTSWDSSSGLSHVMGQSAGKPTFLEDHVHFLRANLSMYEISGYQRYLERAIEILKTTQDLFEATTNGFYDVRPTEFNTNNMDPPDMPVLENGLLAEAMVTIYYLTGDRLYNDLARSTLNKFSQIIPGRSFIGNTNSRTMEEDEEVLFLPAGSVWARAYDMLYNGPIHYILIGDSSSQIFKRFDDMLSGIYAPHKIYEHLDTQENRNRISQLGFPVRNHPELYVCIGSQCLAPINTLDQLRDLKNNPPWR